MSDSRYGPMLDAIIAALQAINPARIVTDNWDDFANRSQEELQAGVWMVTTPGITRYPYEVSDGQNATSSLRATENGRLVVRITGQLLLAPDATGRQITAAEFVLINEVEQLADAAIEIDDLAALHLNGCRMSQQADKPLAWIDSEWEVFALD